MNGCEAERAHPLNDAETPDAYSRVADDLTTPLATALAGRPGLVTWLLPVALPILFVALILGADALEGPKTAYVGVLAVVPMLAAVFATPLQTAAVGLVAWLAALGFGTLASDGNVQAQSVRLIIIAACAVGAVFAARHRTRREASVLGAERAQRNLTHAMHEATTDTLTNILNRRGLALALERHDRDVPLTLALADCDNFRSVNDGHGHAGGDHYLVTTAHRLTHALSVHDVVGRWGGDEFLVALPLPLHEAAAVMGRVRRQITRDPVVVEGDSLTVSMTFGLAEWQPDESLSDVIARADRAMYSGKAHGQHISLDVHVTPALEGTSIL